MANFCNRCGRPLVNGETCNCAGYQPPETNRAPEQTNSTWASIVDIFRGIVAGVKDHMGIGDPELNKGDAYEKNKQIVPDCVRPNEGEVPVKQYEVATLRNRFGFIPFGKATGRMQVTNKRVIFRAPGRSWAGRTTLQHEFAIDELAGVEARREYVFNFGDLLLGLIVCAIGGWAITGLINGICSSLLNDYKVLLPVLLTLIFGAAGLVPFVLLKKKWLLKLLCLGGSCVPLLVFGSMVSNIADKKEELAEQAELYLESGRELPERLSEYGYKFAGISGFFGGVLTFLGILVLICVIFCLFVYCIKPNLVLLVKTKAANEAIDIKRKKFVLFGGLFGGGKEDEHTGYFEVTPADDAESCIREINAVISDIQKLGDYGIEKWKK